MKNIISAAFFTILVLPALAQQTIYFDSAWTETTKDKMVYYRELKEEAPLMRIKDFYKSGQLQMEGLALDATPQKEIFEGKVIWYYENGKIEQIANYQTGRLLGEFKSYQPDGKSYSKLVYDKDGNYSGTYHYFKGGEERDQSIFETIKNSMTETRIIYDEDMKGIRTEEKYLNGGNKIEYKFYGAKGKYLGTAVRDEAGATGTYVMYYYNPMSVMQTQTLKKDGKVTAETWYFRNGKMQSDMKADEKGNETKKFYDASGKFLGELTNKYNSESEYAIAFKGKSIAYDYDGAVESIVEYKNYNVIKASYFEKGKLKKVIINNGSEYNETEKITYYNENGTIKSLLTYEDGAPYNGISYEDDAETHYQNGIAISKKAFYESGKLKYQKIWKETESIFENTVFEENGQTKYYYETAEENCYGGLTGEISIYKNGKPESKIVLKDGILQSGKIAYKISGNEIQEMERTGEWLFVRSFKENELVRESKIKIFENDDDNYDIPKFFEEYLFN